MTELHRELPDSELHTVKGAAFADDGEILIANGSGTTEFDFPTYVFSYTFEDVSTASDQWAVSPFSGDLVEIKAVLHDTIATADTEITFERGGAQITDSTITLAEAGSLPGDEYSSTPSASNNLNAGQGIKITSDGASTNDVNLTLVFILKRTS